MQDGTETDDNATQSSKNKSSKSQLPGIASTSAQLVSPSDSSELETSSPSTHLSSSHLSSSRLRPQPRARYSFEHRILLNLLIEARKASGISQKALSKRLGKSLSHISFIESNDRDITFVEVSRICEIVGLPLTELAQNFSQQVNSRRGKEIRSNEVHGNEVSGHEDPASDSS